MRVAERTARFTESVIREMTRLIEEYPGAGINLAQGFPDFDPPQLLRDAACAAIQGGMNQYSVTWGMPSLRRAIAGKVVRFGGPQFDPEREITVTCGSTEAMAAAVMALVNPGDEVIIFAPYYENYCMKTTGLTPCWPERCRVSCCFGRRIGRSIRTSCARLSPGARGRLL